MSPKFFLACILTSQSLPNNLELRFRKIFERFDRHIEVVEHDKIELIKRRKSFLKLVEPAKNLKNAYFVEQ